MQHTAGESGGMSVPTQRLLRSAVHDPPRSSSRDAATFDLYGVAAEWNCSVAGATLGETQRVMSEVSELQVLRVDIARHGTFAASCCADGSVSLWNMRGEEPLCKHELRYDTGNNKIVGLALNGDGTRMVTHTRDTVCLWDTSIPSCSRIVHTLPRASHTNIVTSAVISDDGLRIATSCGDSVARVFSIGANETTVVEMRGHSKWITGVTISGDGSTVISWSDHEVNLWSSTPAAPVLDSVAVDAPLIPSPDTRPVTPVPLPDPADPADQQRWMDEVLKSAELPVQAPSEPVGGTIPSVTRPSLAPALTYTQVALALDALATKGDSPAVIEQVELGKDGGHLAVRFRTDDDTGGCSGSAFAIWQLCDLAAPMYVVGGHKSRLHDLRISNQQVLSCSDDGELLLWEWAEDAEIAVASRWIASSGAINACALSWKGRVAACGLAGGLTSLLSRHVSHWDAPPRWLGIAKMAPDDWEQCCQVTLTPFTRWTRKHHCRRCGRLICNAASVLGPPRDQQELEDAMRQIRKTKASRLTIRTDSQFSEASALSSDEEAAPETGPEPEPEPEPAPSVQPGLLDVTMVPADQLTAPLEEKLADVKLARLRRCTDCAKFDSGLV